MTREIAFVMAVIASLLGSLTALDRRVHPRPPVLTRDEIALLRLGIRGRQSFVLVKQEEVRALKAELDRLNTDWPRIDASRSR